MKSKKVEMIYERNPDTGDIRSRVIPTTDEIIAFNRNENNSPIETFPFTPSTTEELLDELWESPKVNHQGHWYVRLTDVVRIIEG